MASTLIVPIHFPEKGAIDGPRTGGGLLTMGSGAGAVSCFLQAIIIMVDNNRLKNNIISGNAFFMIKVFKTLAEYRQQQLKRQ